jgi:Tol biopolymer transport system component
VTRLPRSLATAVALLLLAAAPAAAVSPGENGRIYFHAIGPTGSAYDIYSVAPGGGDLVNLTEALTAPPGLPDSAFEPSVSADGSRVAFSVDTQASSEIWVLNADGTGAHQLTHDNLLDQAPAISPDGSRIVWNQWSPFPGYTDRDLWTMASDGSGQQLFYDGSNEERASQFTPDGQTLVMASETGDYDIRKIPAALMSPPLTTSTGVADEDDQLAYEPTVSPDGSRVAYMQLPVSAPLGSPFDIYGVSIEGGTPVPLFDSAGSERDPSYSPDGTKMAFSVDGVAMIGNADGSGEPQTLDVGSALFPGGFEWAVKPKSTEGPPPPPGSAPNGRIGKHPKKRTKNHRAKFTFSSSQAGSHFECKLDKRRYRPCKSPFQRKLKTGRHTFRVRAVNTAGMPDPTPATFRWRILPG